MSESTYTIGDYLLDRLAELGITEMFGLPGDYNLRFLDHVLAHDQIRWVGSANELNAGYAADGYARVRGASALLTTFGVGELSAINAIAGSRAESVPVIHIVGAPSKEIQAAGQKVHHSLGDGDFEHFARMARELCCVVADLEAPTATWEIDHVLRTVMFAKQPGTLILAADVAATPAQPPVAPLERITEWSTPAAEAAFESALRSFLPGKRVTVLADLLVHRVGATESLNALLDATKLPVATLSWGKTLVDESSADFIGIYAGGASPEPVRAAVEDADALITVGVEFTDNTTGGFSMDIDPSRRIDVRRHAALVGRDAFAPLAMARSIEIVQRVLLDLGAEGTPVAQAEVESPVAGEPTDRPLTQDALWARVAGALSSDNLVLADQGTSYFGLSAHRFPRGTLFIGQPMWGSIGYTLPAMLGAGLADRSRRPVLFIGDGSAQLTIQELGQIIREGLPAVIVLVNNAGYTVERAIHGAEATYNDVPGWNWKLAPEFFGAPQGTFEAYTATTDAELAEALDRATAAPDKLVLIEAIADPHDTPAPMRAVTDNL